LLRQSIIQDHRFFLLSGDKMYRICVFLILIFWSFLGLGRAHAFTIDTLYVPSASMHKKIPALVVMPTDTSVAYPVLYLLHGYGGSFGDWQRHIDLQPLADQFQMAIICPDGSPDSWYLDSPLQKDSQYETFITRELLPYIAAHYPLKEGRAFRGIDGLSMGGHGALFLAIRHGDLFGVAASMSGGVDLTFSTVRWKIAQKIGDFKTYPQRWKDNSVVNMVLKWRPPYPSLMIDDGVDDIFIGVNRTLHKNLLKRGIPHDYVERPGRHSWDYWTRALKYHLLFFREQFGKEQP